MALLQPRLNLKVSQRQVLTPGLMQMVSVLALNKLELKEMIDAEMVENPVLEEIDETVPMLDEVASKQEHDLQPPERLDVGTTEPAAEPKDPFNEIDFGSYFQDYLDPGYRTQPEYEDSEKPSFENFLSQPTTLSDHLAWQLGALTLEPELVIAAPKPSTPKVVNHVVLAKPLSTWSAEPRPGTIIDRTKIKATL
jgi:RNA polymerase sigma-54 factor